MEGGCGVYKLKAMIYSVVLFLCDTSEDITTLADNPSKRNTEIEAVTSIE